MSVILLSMYSCNFYRHVPDGKAILWENKIEEEGKGDVPAAAAAILKQRPVYQFLGIDFLAPGLTLYNWGNGTDSSFFSRLGEPPIIFDSLKAHTGAEQLRDFYFNNGYFQASSSYSVKKEKNGKRAIVTYYIKPGPQYFIRNISRDIPNKAMKELYTSYEKDKLVHEGDAYNTKAMNMERERLTNIYRNNGFFNFSKNFIRFEADTFISGEFVDLKMIISKRAIQKGDTVVYREHERFKLNNIYFQPDYNYISNDPADDTLLSRGYHLIFDTLDYKPRYLTDAVHFYSGDLYDQQALNNTYSHLLSYNAFQNIDISYKEVGIDSSGPLLDVLIKASPHEKKTFTTEIEGTTTSGNYGVNLSVGWINRNFFRGGEELQVKINSGIDYQSALSQSQLSRTFELGAEIGMKFPRFLLPFNTVGLVPKSMTPSSRISFYGNRFYRSEFDRVTWGTLLSYNWKQTVIKSWQIDLIDISYSRFYSIDDEFRSRLNEIQQITFQPAFISATKATFTLNQQVYSSRTSYNFFRTSLEVAGNTLALLENNTGLGEEDNRNGQGTIGNVPYFQYVKADIDYRFYWNITSEYSWVNRIYAATIRPYGNSIINENGQEIRNAPFSKFLFIGGSNDLRAWPAYRLGAGTQSNTDYYPQKIDKDGNPVYDKGAAHDTSFALGTIKFLYNTEYRFPLFSFFKGAFFIDAGNIWLNGGLQNENTNFEINKLLEQLAIGGGVGLRMDFDYFLVRFDVAAKIRDPGRIPINDPWVFNNHPLRNLTYNIALGYPF